MSEREYIYPDHYNLLWPNVESPIILIAITLSLPMYQ
jgi:hypothetical protein